MGETTTCTWCSSSVDTDRDRHFLLSRTSIDVRDSRKETGEQLLCSDCGAEYLDFASARSEMVGADPLDPSR